LVAMTLLAVFMGWLGWELKVVRDRKAMVKWLESHGGNIFDYPNRTGELSLLRRALGDVAYSPIFLRPNTTDEERANIARLFPEADFLEPPAK